MNEAWAVVSPLVRSSLLVLTKVLAGLALMFLMLWGAQRFMSPSWAEADASAQAAQAGLDEARRELADVRSHLPQFNQLLEAGLVGGERRSDWMDDFLRTVKASGLQGHVSFTLAPPEWLALPEAEAAQAKVLRHALEFQVVGVHEIEALRLIQQIRGQHGPVSRMAACLFEAPEPTGLSAKCRIDFLNIAPQPSPLDPALQQGSP